MATGLFNSDSRYYINVDGSLVSQSQAGNSSATNGYVQAVKTSGTGYWGSPGASGSAGTNQGTVWSNGSFGYDFRGTAPVVQTYFSGNWTTPHDANGYASYYINGYLTINAIGSASAGTGWRGLPRIPKRPSVPGTPVASNVLPTSLDLAWAASSDNKGSTITSYLLRRWLGVSPTGAYEDDNANNISRGVSGLQPGTDYTFAVFAKNGSADNGGYSNVSGYLTVKTLAPLRLKVAGVWRYAVPYVKFEGVWVLALPYVKSGGVWKAAS